MRSSLHAATTSIAGTVRISVVRRQRRPPSRSAGSVVLEAREERERDVADGPHRHLEDVVDEAVGESVEPDRGRPEEDAHEECVGAAVDEAAQVGEEDAAREADELAVRCDAGEAEARPPGAHRPEKHELRPGEAELLRDERPDSGARAARARARARRRRHCAGLADGERPEAHLTLEEPELDDREPVDHEQDREDLAPRARARARRSDAPTSRREQEARDREQRRTRRG